jgi:hypothetical protein
VVPAAASAAAIAKIVLRCTADLPLPAARGR